MPFLVSTKTQYIYEVINLAAVATVATVQTISEVANSQVVWSILCIGLAIYVLWHSNKREARLLDNLEKFAQSLGEQTETMKDISESLTKLEGRIDRIEKHTYKKGDF